MRATQTRNRTPMRERLRHLPRLRLSSPSKMRGYSFALPAGPACPMARRQIREHGTRAICASCYAASGVREPGKPGIARIRGTLYRLPNVRDVRESNMSAIQGALRIGGPRAAALFLYDALEGIRGEYFRIHDSGDFYSPGYVDAWRLAISALRAAGKGPRYFWAPTRAHELGGPMLAALQRLNALPGVSIRPSAACFGDAPPVVDGLDAGSTSEASADVACPAPSSPGRSCASAGCDVCWTRPELSVSYHAH